MTYQTINNIFTIHIIHAIIHFEKQTTPDHPYVALKDPLFAYYYPWLRLMDLSDYYQLPIFLDVIASLHLGISVSQSVTLLKMDTL